MNAATEAEIRRGTGWVVAQFVLMGVIIAAAFLPPRWPDGVRVPLFVVGAILVGLGLGLVVWAARTMGSLLTPFPKPASDGRLVVDGPFAIVRHPVYLGGILLFAGIALMTSLPALAVTFVLALLWHGKAQVEERHLRARFPEYTAYAGRVRSSIPPLRARR